MSAGIKGLGFGHGSSGVKASAFGHGGSGGKTFRVQAQRQAVINRKKQACFFLFIN